MYSATKFVVAQNMIHPSTKCGNKITSMWPSNYNHFNMYSAAQFVVAQNMIHPSTKCGNKITSMWPSKYNTTVVKGRTMSQSDKKKYRIK